MIDYNCIHNKVCSYTGFAYESCDKCKFREYHTLNTDRQILDANEFMMALEDVGPDVCEHYELSETIHGYSHGRIQEVVDEQVKHAEETVGVCIEHEWAEEENDRLISDFECPYCGEWHREEEVDKFCSHCGKPIMIVHKERKRCE